MGPVELGRLLEDYVQRSPLPTILGAVVAGAFLTFLAMLTFRLARGGQSLELIKELKDQNERLSLVNHDLKKEGGSLEDQVKGLEREKERLDDKVKTQDGHAAALKEQIIELSSVCERVTTENFELREQLKRDKKVRRQAQKLARDYSSQLDAIAHSDGKIWLRPTNGQLVPFLPLSMRRAAIISLANLKGRRG